MSTREQALEAAAREAREYFDNRSDVMDGDYGIPEANEEMRLLTEIDAALALPREEWRPISEAPRNRNLIVGWKNERGNWRSAMGRYYPKSTLDAGEYDDPSTIDEDGYAPEGWYEESETHESVSPIDPTHFRHLPPPPENSDA